MYTKTQLCSGKENRWHRHQGLAEHGDKHTASRYATTLSQGIFKKDPLKRGLLEKPPLLIAFGEDAEVKQPSSDKASPEHRVHLSMTWEFTQATKDLWSQLELRAPQQYTKSVPLLPWSPLLWSSCFSTAFVQFCTLRLNRTVIPSLRGRESRSRYSSWSSTGARSHLAATFQSAHKSKLLP